jgi:type IV/VI secretion system ImpK/VasF family protein
VSASVSSSLSRWRLIDRALAEVDKDIERALLEDAIDVAALARRVEGRFDALSAGLTDAGTDPAVRAEALVALAFLVDERVLVRLSERSYARQTEWPRLERFEDRERFGGDAFFSRARRIVAEPVDPEGHRRERLEVYLYCLGQGFEGRYAGRSEELETQRSVLWNALGQSAPPLATSQASAPRGGVARFWILALIACTIVLLPYVAALGAQTLGSAQGRA